MTEIGPDGNRTLTSYTDSLQWGHNERVSIVCPKTVCSGADQRKYKNSASLVPGGFPSQRTSNAENVSIWWRHSVGKTIMLLSYENILAVINTKIHLSYLNTLYLYWHKNSCWYLYLDEDTLRESKAICSKHDLFTKYCHVVARFSVFVLFVMPTVPIGFLPRQ